MILQFFESSQNAVSRNNLLKFSGTMVEKRRLQHRRGMRWRAHSSLEQKLQHLCTNHSSKSSRQELLESNGSGSGRSNENAEGTRLGLANLCCTRGRFSADVWLEREGEKGGEGEGEQEKLYFRFPGPTLMGRGDGGVGGEDDGVAPPDPINEQSLNFFPLLSAAPSIWVTGSLRDWCRCLYSVRWTLPGALVWNAGVNLTVLATGINVPPTLNP